MFHFSVFFKKKAKTSRKYYYLCVQYLGADVRSVSTGDEFSQKAVQLGAFDVSVTWKQQKNVR